MHGTHMYHIFKYFILGYTMLIGQPIYNVFHACTNPIVIKLASKVLHKIHIEINVYLMQDF